MHSYFQGLVERWLKPELGDDYFSSATATAWFIWKSRCEKVFGGIHPNPTLVMDRIQASLAPCGSITPASRRPTSEQGLVEAIKFMWIIK